MKYAKIVQYVKENHISWDTDIFDILKEYYQDEEEDMYWAEQQLELIEKIGLQNWLNQQL